MFWNKKRKIYMDYAAATPIDKRVALAMDHAVLNTFANPSGLHSLSLQARRIIDDSRKKVAKLLSARTEEIIFTRGGTESNYLAILGVYEGFLNRKQITLPNSGEGVALGATGGDKPHIIISAIEHNVILDTVKKLKKEEKIELSIIPVTQDGIIDIQVLKGALRPNTILVSIMYANNEIGVIQPIAEIAKIIRHRRKESGNIYPLFHTDAIQAVNYCNMNVQRLGVDLMSISGSKIYGPKSTAVLFKKNNIPLGNVFSGGEQEMGFRPGTEDIAGIVGFTQALEITLAMQEEESLRLKELQNYFFGQLRALHEEIQEKKSLASGESDSIYINGSRETRLPNNIHISIEGVTGERLIIELDGYGICASSKAVCQTNEEGESHVVLALRNQIGSSSVMESYGSVRFSMGRYTARRDINTVIIALRAIINKLENEKSIKNIQISL